MPGRSGVKKVTQRYLMRTGEDTPEQLPYRIMDWLIANHEPQLAEMRIAIVWHHGLKPGLDGKIILGRARLCSDVERQKTGLDGDITLNFEWWHHNRVTEDNRKTLVHHELLHFSPHMDEDNTPKRDEMNNIRYYSNRHDLEEFKKIVRIWGLWKEDLQEMAQEMAAAQGLIPTAGRAQPTEGDPENLDDLPI